MVSANRLRWLAIAVALLGTAAHADVITTADGARLVGKVNKITAQNVELATTYAGTIAIAMDQVATLETDTPVTTRFQDQTTVTGVTRIDAERAVSIEGDGLTTTSTLDRLMASWLPDATPPPESGYDPRRWVYSVGADVAGKNGNSDEISTNFLGDAALVTKLDEFRLYASYARAEQESEETSDQTIAGASYAAYMYDPWGWYVRGELERDPFEDIDLRTTAAGGLSYRPINTDVRTLKFFAGVGYRHESFQDGIDESSGVLDLGLNHRWVVQPWLTMNNALTYTPAFDDFADYLFVHDSSLELPVGASKWVLRLGVRNDYKNKPAPDREELDTAYYTRLLMRFE
jgi:putative salt-induced outer membrane protein YdiY